MKFRTLPLALLCAALLLAAAGLASAFAPPRPHVQASSTPSISLATRTVAGAGPLFGFMGDKDRDRLTRDSEPEDYFRT
jgi:hypothetical protein